MRLANQWRDHRREWSAVDYRWPEGTDGGEDDLDRLGFRLACRMTSEGRYEYGLECFVYEAKSQPAPDPFGDAKFIVQLIVQHTVHYIYLPDLPDFVEVLAKVEPVVRATIRTEQLVEVWDLREELRQRLEALDAAEGVTGWIGEPTPDSQLSAWLNGRLLAPGFRASDVDPKVRALVRWLRAHEGASTARDIQRVGVAGVQNQAEVTALLQAAEAACCVRLNTESRGRVRVTLQEER